MGGGSSSSKTSTSYDPMSSMASFMTAMQSNQRSSELWDIYKSDFLPYDKASMQANTELMGVQKDLAKQQLADEQATAPYRTQAQIAGLQEAIADLNANKPIKSAQRAAQLSEIQTSAPVTQAFYDKALEGVTPQTDRVMGQASADVAQAYEGAIPGMQRNLARTGVGLSSGRQAAAATNLAQSQARDLAFARTTARENEIQRADTIGYARLGDAMSARSRALSGNYAQGLENATIGALPTMQAQQYWSPTSNPLNASISYQGLAQQGLSSLASRSMGSTTTQSGGGDGGAMKAVAGLAGTAIGSFAGPLGAAAGGALASAAAGAATKT